MSHPLLLPYCVETICGIKHLPVYAHWALLEHKLALLEAFICGWFILTILLQLSERNCSFYMLIFVTRLPLHRCRHAFSYHIVQRWGHRQEALALSQPAQILADHRQVWPKNIRLDFSELLLRTFCAPRWTSNRKAEREVVCSMEIKDQDKRFK